MANLLSVICEAVRKGDDQKVGHAVEEALKSGISAIQVLDQGLVLGMQALGESFKKGDVYLPEILISIRAMNRGVDLLGPHLAGQETKREGTVVIGTIEGDLHDIGKNLVKIMLEGNGFHVVDLGVDVSPAFFAAAAGKHRTDIVAVSSLLTTTMNALSEVIDALKRSGLRDNLSVLVGGAPLTREFADRIGADGFAEDCVSVVDEAKRLMAIR